MDYKYLEHTADVKFEAYGSSYSELFTNCAHATTNLIVSRDSYGDDVLKKVNVASYDMKSLLHDFLEEILFLFEADRFLVSEIPVIEIDSQNFTLYAKLKGELVDKQKHEIKSELKAVTYNDMEISETEDGLKAVVVIDI